MAVIAILATVLIPTFSNLITQAEDVKALQEANNVWKSYAISHPTDFSNDVVSIQVGNRFFTARQGKLANTHTNTPADGAIAVITADSTNGFVCVIHNISKKDCNICGAKHEHSFIEANDNKLPFCECGIPQPHDCLESQ